MLAQRVLSILMLLLFAAGCGSQPQQGEVTDGTANGNSPRQGKPTEEVSGQMIADLPSDIREVGSPDTTVPGPPSKKKPEP